MKDLLGVPPRRVNTFPFNSCDYLLGNSTLSAEIVATRQCFGRESFSSTELFRQDCISWHV